jgi:hypothetical protein
MSHRLISNTYGRHAIIGALWLGLLILNIGALGSRLAFETISVVISAICILEAWSTGLRVLTTATLIVGVIGVFYPPILRLDGYWLFMLGSTPAMRPLALFPLCHWATQYIPTPLIALLLLPPLVSGIGLIIPSKWIKPAIATMSLLLAGVSVFHLKEPQKRYEIDENSKFAFAYKISKTVKNIFPECFGGEDVIRSLYHGTKTDPSKHGIVIAEHDIPPSQWNGRVDKGNFIQRSPWNKNEFIGDQYWRYAIACDGYLVSNKGGRLLPSTHVLLAFPFPNPFKSTLLATSGDGITYCADSDYWVNKLSNYQQNLLGVIIGAKRKTTPPIIANIIFAIGAVGGIYWSWLFALGVVGPFVLFFLPAPQIGSVRLVGGCFYPHDPTRGWAVLRQLQEDEIPVVKGEKGTKVLIVEQGKAASVNNERLVIAEPNSEVRIGSHLIKTDDLPLGFVDDIPDSRYLLLDGKNQGTKVVVDGVTVIGTGSPSLVPRELWNILQAQ